MQKRTIKLSNKVIAAGLALGLSAGLSACSMFSAQEADTSKPGAEATDHKCGEGKCGDDHKCGEAKCGDDHKCGEGKCGH